MTPPIKPSVQRGEGAGDEPQESLSSALPVDVQGDSKKPALPALERVLLSTGSQLQGTKSRVCGKLRAAEPSTARGLQRCKTSKLTNIVVGSS